MKMRRPTTDKEMAVYGNGVFIVVQCRGNVFMFLRVILNLTSILRIFFTINKLVRPNQPPYTVCLPKVPVFHGTHRHRRVYMLRLI